MLLTSPDGRRAVVTGVPLHAETWDIDAAVQDRPHRVLGVTDTGEIRLWATRTRAELRRVAAAYRSHGGSTRALPTGS